MTSVVYRPLEERDFEAAVDVRIESAADMLRRQGLPPPEGKREQWNAKYTHTWRTGIFQVAEVDGRIAAVANAIVRGNVWFLCAFWTLPAMQGRGIGGPLLRRVHEEGQRQGARVFAVLASPEFPALATYMKLGMVPGCQVFKFDLEAGATVVVPEVVLDCEPLKPEAAAMVDRAVRGMERAVDHEFWRSTGTPTLQFTRGGKAVGYSYAKPGTIGPVAWLDDADGPEIFGRALAAAMPTEGKLPVSVPGTNHTAIRMLLSAGAQIRGVSHYLTSAQVGRVGRYVPLDLMMF
jgi:GNAT superfamily N-acetyltransferase